MEEITIKQDDTHPVYGRTINLLRTINGNINLRSVRDYATTEECFLTLTPETCRKLVEALTQLCGEVPHKSPRFTSERGRITVEADGIRVTLADGKVTLERMPENV